MMFNLKKTVVGVAAAFTLGGASSLAFAFDNKIEDVSASNVAGNIVVKVDLEKPLNAIPSGFSMTNPSKIALDFPSSKNGVGKASKMINEGVLRSVNVVETGDRTRMVLNLSENMQYDARLEGNSVFITLKATESLGSGSPFKIVATSTGSHSVEDVVFHRGKDGEGRIVVAMNDSTAGVEVKRQGSKLLLDFSKTKAPTHLLKNLNVVDFATPVQTVDTKSVGDGVRMTITPKGQWDYQTYQSNNQFVVEVKKIELDPTKLSQGAVGEYNGPKVSLNYHNGEVRSLLRLMAEELGLNAVISEAITGNITLVLKDVPADQVLDIVFMQKGLDKRKNGNVVVIAPAEELTKREQEDLRAKKEKTALEPLRQEKFVLNYQKSGNVAKLLMGQSVVDSSVKGSTGNSATTQSVKMLSDRGSAISDGTSNLLFVNDIPSKLEDVRKFIQSIDYAPKQVQIEARIVEANDKFARNLGMRLNFLKGSSSQIGKSGVNIGGGSYDASGQVTNQTIGVNLPGYNSKFGGSNGGGLMSFSLFNSALSNILNLELAALDADGAGKIISNPRVVTPNNTKAKIEDGSDIPVVTPGSANGAATVTYKEAKLSLETTPQITPDGNVRMKLTIRKEEPNWSNTVVGNPEIKSSVIETEAIVENGGTLVIGGVFKTNNSNTREKVPVLGDVPYVGWLFKYEEKSTEVRELLIFVSPKILDSRVGL